mmetsp:Transcript_24166/g.78760  ORF Transcript_24166/g.78760 Transcript_24166/m.78760 type:complete len:211 (+) Transcript_24166:1901-2533(+)
MTCPPTCFCISPTAAPQRNLDGRQEEREGRYRLTSTTLTTCHLKSLVYILPFLDPELLVSMHKNVPRVRYPDVVLASRQSSWRRIEPHLEDLLDDVGGDERVSSDRGGMVDASLRRDLELRRLKAHPEVVRVNQRLALHAVEDDTCIRCSHEVHLPPARREVLIGGKILAEIIHSQLPEEEIEELGLLKARREVEHLPPSPCAAFLMTLV